MANEKATEDVETSEEDSKDDSVSEDEKTPSEEEPKKQPSEEEESVSEDEKTPSKSDKGDLGKALKEERLKRQTLERNLQDPNFVYERIILLLPEAH